MTKFSSILTSITVLLSQSRDSSHHVPEAKCLRQSNYRCCKSRQHSCIGSDLAAPTPFWLPVCHTLFYAYINSPTLLPTCHMTLGQLLYVRLKSETLCEHWNLRERRAGRLREKQKNWTVIQKQKLRAMKHSTQLTKRPPLLRV
jgi:hypothetical protein